MLSEPSVTQFQIAYATEATYDLPPRWSMVSLALDVEDASLGSVFPDAISLFRFSDGYEPATELVQGEGYWTNLGTGGAYAVTGTPSASMVLDLPAGWSMVGPGSNAVDVPALKLATGNDVISVFGFAGSYVSATTMEPGGGYWVNLASAGQIDLSGSVSKPLSGQQSPTACISMNCAQVTSAHCARWC